MKEKIKKIPSLLAIIFLFFFSLFLITEATSGACSWHGGVNCSAGADWDGSVICNDGWRDSSVSYYSMVECIGHSNPPFYTPSIPNCPLNSYYDSLSDSCKCYTGYVVSENKCVSADQLCRDQYGVMAKYNSLYNKCECFVGYVFGKDAIGRTQCISKDDWCQNEYGYNSRYNILIDKCECNSGYEFNIKSGGVLECESCISKYGLHSSYNYVDKKCECDEGYILGDDGCVIQQKTITCPLNSTLIGDQCFCDSGYIASGSSCITYDQNCQNKYGPHTYSDSNYCYCEEGYVWNKEGTKCITHTEDCRLIYGEHVVGAKGDADHNSFCNCETGYTWNSSKTACIQIEPASIFIITTTVTKPVTNTTKVILENKNQKGATTTQMTEVKNSLDHKIINSSATESQKEVNIQGNTQNSLNKILGFFHLFIFKLFK